MRIAPVLIPHLREPSPAVWTDAILATAVTHADSAAIASSVAFTELPWNLLGARRPPESDEWWDQFCDCVRQGGNRVSSPDARFEPARIQVIGIHRGATAARARPAFQRLAAPAHGGAPGPICWRPYPRSYTSWRDIATILKRQSSQRRTTPGTMTRSRRSLARQWAPCTGPMLSPSAGFEGWAAGRDRMMTAECRRY